MGNSKSNEYFTQWYLQSIFDEEVPLIETFRGQPLLILFFYLGCPGCKGRAIPFANSLIYEKTPVQIVGIHSRFEGRAYTNKELQAAKSEFYIRFPYFKDINDHKTFTKFQAGGTPHWILLDKEGKLVMSIFGSDPNNALLRLDLKIKELNGTA